MQEIVKAMNSQKTTTGAGVTRDAKQVKILTPDVEEDEITVGPALFGPDLRENGFQASYDTVALFTVNLVKILCM